MGEFHSGSYPGGESPARKELLRDQLSSVISGQPISIGNRESKMPGV